MRELIKRHEKQNESGIMRTISYPNILNSICADIILLVPSQHTDSHFANQCHAILLSHHYHFCLPIRRMLRTRTANMPLEWDLKLAIWYWFDMHCFENTNCILMNSSFHFNLLILLGNWTNREWNRSGEIQSVFHLN